MKADNMVDPSELASAASAHEQFQADGIYLNTASLGLPPRSSLETLRAVLDGMREGRSTGL